MRTYSKTRTGLIGLAVAGTAVGGAGYAITSASAEPVHDFPAKVDLNGRMKIGQPATASGAKVDIYREGQQVPVTCQAALEGALWIKTADRVWVPDIYVRTGTDGFAPGVPHCAEDDGSLGGGGTGQKAHEFPAKVDLNGRQQIGQPADAPGAKVDIYRAGQQVPVQCMAAHQGSLWIKTTDNVWVPDQYVTTGTDGYAPGVDKCGEDDGSLNGDDGDDDGGSGSEVPKVDGLPGAPEPNPHGPATSQAPNLTPRTKHIIGQVDAAFGRDVVQCDPSAYRPYEGATSNHNTGNASDCTVGNDIGEYPNNAQRANGWKVAKWLRQHADALNVHYVIWDGKIWSVAKSGQGWREYTGGSGVTAGHYDHVHISVQNPHGDGNL